MERKCERCGSCCVQLRDGHDITEEDIKRWVDQMRHDILWFCSGWTDACFDALLFDKKKLIRYFSEDFLNREMWFSPQDGSELSLCPFLRKAYGKNRFECFIHDTKPEICRDYLCDPKNMDGIIKKPFQENLEQYRKKRRSSPSYMKFWSEYTKDIGQ